MADSRKHADEVLAVALAAGRRIEDASREAGVSARTAARRMREPEFAARVRELRGRMVDAVVGRLGERSSAAADRLAALVESPNEAIALKAAKAVIELGFRARDVAETEQRIAALEAAQAAAQEKGERGSRR